MISLSPHFSLNELTVTDVHDVDNTPTQEIIRELHNTAMQMERVRKLLFDNVIIVTSGYRCHEVNTRVGGSVFSAHLMGYACDFICPKFGRPIDVCRQIAGSDIFYDQLIQEGSWTHISFDPRMRHEVLTCTSAKTYAKGLV